MDYWFEIMRRANMEVTDLQGLCADIPSSIYCSPEIVPFNDFYGNAEQLKKFLNIASCYQLKVAIQHGNQYGDAYWDEEIKETLPISLAWGEHIYSIWKKCTSKKIFKIGAPFFYTHGLLDDIEVGKARDRLGKNLLVFPAHSMHNSTISFETEAWIGKIQSISKKFDTVRICIYWKDYVLGRHKPYLDAGYECVTAGHIFDCNFLPRLRSLLEISDASLSNRIGSFIGYSIFLGRPHVYIDQKIDIKDHNNIGRVQEEENAWRRDPGVQKIFQSFSSSDFFITDEQIASLDPYFGFSEIKSKSELIGILLLAEELYAGKENPSFCFKKLKNQKAFNVNMKKTVKNVIRPLWNRLPQAARHWLRGEVDTNVICINTKFGEIFFHNVNPMAKYRADTFFTKEPETLRWIESFEKNAVLWDIGANIGLYSLYAVLASGSSVVAFEPHPFNIELLTKNILLNKMEHSVNICTCPLSDANQQGDFNMSGCYNGASGATFGEKYGQDGEIMDNFSSVSLFSLSADTFMSLYGLEYPDYVKIDVDGIEHLILKGMQEILANKKLKSVLVECCDLFAEQKLNISQILSQYGFKLKEIGTSPLYKEGVDSYTHNYIYALIA